MIDERRKFIISVNLIVTSIASSFLQTALTTALPPIINDLDISVSQGQWLTSGYSLAMGIMMPLSAFLIIRFPAKKLFLSAVGMFLTGLAVCIFAPNFPIMMSGRVLQACSNGITGSMVQVVLLTIYPAEKRGSVMGWYGLSIGAAPVIAPTIAGVLVDTLGWRSIFVISFVILGIAFVMALFLLEDVLETRRQKFDIASFVLSVFAFGGLTLGIGNITSIGISSPGTFCPLAAGVLAGIIFVYRQLHIEEPFLELRILKTFKYAFSVVCSMMMYFVMMGSSVIMPIYVQSILGYSATVSGLVTLPGSLAMAVISPLAGRIFDKFGMRKLAVTGAILLALSNIGMCFVGTDTILIVPAILNLFRSVSLGCLMMPLVTFGTNSIGSANTAHGTALLTSLRTVSGAIGAAVFVGIMNMISVKDAAGSAGQVSFSGLHVSYMCMTAGAVVMLALTLFFARKLKD